MNPPTDDHTELPIYDAGEEHRPYTLEFVAKITGVSSQTILHYQEQGLIHTSAEARDAFDDETVHTLRRIEHLRHTCETNDSGLKLILGLMDQVEELRAALRRR